jgi:CBS domain-containing protein
VGDIMQPVVATVASTCPLPDLERAFTKYGISGFPVVDDGCLVGVVSRSDVVRQICVERSTSEVISDYYHEQSRFSSSSYFQSFDDIAESVGRRIEHLTVADVMTPEIISIRPDEPVSDAAQIMVERRVHRVPVVDDGQLIGLLTSMDIVRHVARRDSDDDARTG